MEDRGITMFSHYAELMIILFWQEYDQSCSDPFGTQLAGEFVAKDLSPTCFGGVPNYFECLY